MKDITHACAFTGHRPERLTIPERKVITWLEEKIDEAVAEGYTTFITGMQRGVDIWAAEIVLKLREMNPGLTLIAASAFKGMENSWESSWKRRYDRIIDAADEVFFISNKPGRRAFFDRNEWMVDRASRLIAVYNDAPGGTQRTIEYASLLGREIIQIDL